MGLPGGHIWLKYLMLFISILVLLAGSLAFAFGLYLRFEAKTICLFQIEGSSTLLFTVAVYLLIGAGALMMVVGSLGCYGAIQESPFILELFFFSLLIIFAVEVAAGIWGFSNQSKVVDDVTQLYRATIENYKQNRQEPLKNALTCIQHGLNCCGPSGSQFEFDETCPKRQGLDEFIFKSCPVAIDEVLNYRPDIFGGVGIAIGVVMIFGMLFSMMQCCAIKKTREIV